jgi:hypothetical protein
MAAEVKLQPGWFRRDVQKAVERLGQWSKSENGPAPETAPKPEGSSARGSSSTKQTKGESV